MTRADERAPTAGRIDHVIFGNVNEQGLRPVAWSFEDHDQDDLDWVRQNLDRFVGLENFLERTPPATAFSYVRFRGDRVAVIRRHDDGTGSQGRNRADILIGHQDDLEATTALGLDGLHRVWNVAVPPQRRLPDVPAQALAAQAERELPALIGRRGEVRRHAREVLAAMGTYKDKRLLLVGMREELKRPLLLLVEDVRRRHPDLFGEVGLTFSTYEAHSQDVQGAPGFVFVPDYPSTVSRRVVVDLTLNGRSKTLPSPDMVEYADEALSSLVEDRPPSWLAGAASVGAAHQPALVGGGRATQAPPTDPARGPHSRPDREPAGLPNAYIDNTAGDPPYRRGSGAGGPEPVGPPIVRTNEWVADLLATATPDEFWKTCKRMMRDSPDAAARRIALDPIALLHVYSHGVELASATGAQPQFIRDSVLALAFGNDYAELDKPEGADYLFRLVRATARCPEDDFGRVKGLMAEVVHRFRNQRRGSGQLTTVLANDYFESLDLAPLKVPGSERDSGRRRLPRLTAKLGSGHSVAQGLRTAFQRDDGKPAIGMIVVGVACLIAAAALAFMLVQTTNDGTPAPVAPSPTTAPSAGTTPAEVAPRTDPAVGPAVQPVMVAVAALDDETRATLPVEAGGRTAGAVVYVVWRSTSPRSFVFGERCMLDWPTGELVYVCRSQSRPAGAAAAGEMVVVASPKALFDQRNNPLVAEGLNGAGLIDGMTPLAQPVRYG